MSQSTDTASQLSTLIFVLDWDVVRRRPSPDVFSSQGRFGLALHLFVKDTELFCFIHPKICSMPFYSQLGQQLLDPTFLEAFFLVIAWETIDSEHQKTLFFSKCLGLLDGEETTLFRLLSLRELPTRNSSWGERAKGAFLLFMKIVTDKVSVVCCTTRCLIPPSQGIKKARDERDYLDSEALRRTFLERAAAWEKQQKRRE